MNTNEITFLYSFKRQNEQNMCTIHVLAVTNHYKIDI